MQRSDSAMHRLRFGLSTIDVIAVTLTSMAVILVASSFWFQSRSHQRTVQAANFLCEVHRAQCDFFDQHGFYAEDLASLDLRLPIPVDYELGEIQRTESGWTLAASRNDSMHSTLRIDQAGWNSDLPTQTAPNQIMPNQSLQSNRAKVPESRNQNVAPSHHVTVSAK